MTERVTTGALPEWWGPLLDRVASVRAEEFSRLAVPDEGGRPSAVLVLLADDRTTGPDVLLLQRAADMRAHAGQPAFPGGAADSSDVDVIATALREANEEVGLNPATVDVQAALPSLWIPVSNFVVTPVLAWWRSPHPVAPADPREVELVARVPLAHLADPTNRLLVRHRSGFVGPAFRTENMLVWGFTAGILSRLLELGGWARPWDPAGRPEDLPAVFG
jgi:8-oxo-dGTP pyrophosphatase MutT (NUDIX family)